MTSGTVVLTVCQHQNVDQTVPESYKRRESCLPRVLSQTHLTPHPTVPGLSLFQGLLLARLRPSCQDLAAIVIVSPSRGNACVLKVPILSHAVCPPGANHHVLLTWLKKAAVVSGGAESSPLCEEAMGRCDWWHRGRNTVTTGCVGSEGLRCTDHPKQILLWRTSWPQAEGEPLSPCLAHSGDRICFG